MSDKIEGLKTCNISSTTLLVVQEVPGIIPKLVLKRCQVDHPEEIEPVNQKFVTLGDEEAKKRKVQKTILERKGPPTFSCAVEMISKTECQVHHKLDATVDAILAGKAPKFEARKMHNKSTESKVPLVIPDREYEIESLPLYQEDMVTKSISSEGNLSEDFAASRQTKIKSMPSDDNFGVDFVYTRKAKGKKSVPGKSLVHVYTYQKLNARAKQDGIDSHLILGVGNGEEMKEGFWRSRASPLKILDRSGEKLFAP